MKGFLSALMAVVVLWPCASAGQNKEGDKGVVTAPFEIRVSNDIGVTNDAGEHFTRKNFCTMDKDGAVVRLRRIQYPGSDKAGMFQYTPKEQRGKKSCPKIIFFATPEEVRSMPIEWATPPKTEVNHERHRAIGSVFLL